MGSRSSPARATVIQANMDFTIQMAVSHLNTGFFTNPNENFFAAPQEVDLVGNIKGHSPVVIESLDALDQTTPTNPSRFAFFKALNAPAVNGILSAEVSQGLPAGVYRLASINTPTNHQPVLVAVEQHGSLDDMVYFSVTASME